MAAPIYRDEFERRFMEMIGFVNTSIESQRIRITQDINANTDTKFAAIIAHYDRELAATKQDILQVVNQRFQENERMLRTIAQALNISSI